MEDLIKWLMQIEMSAKSVYYDAAAYFKSDSGLSEFLLKSADDEKWHYDVMNTALQYLSLYPNKPAEITINEEIKKGIELEFEELSIRIVNATLTKKQMIESLVKLEFSEWNDIFLFIVNHFKSKSIDFKIAAAKFQNHIKHIETYASGLDFWPELKKLYVQLPSVWTENILIVDDELEVAEFLSNLLNRDGNIDIASDGVQALEMIKDRYYKLIISDIDMPKMDGISLIKKAKDYVPHINNKTLFISGNISAERKRFFEDNNIRYLPKPSSIRTIRETAQEILSNND